MRPNQKIKIKNYSVRIPQWKKNDKEIQQLTKQYDQIDPGSIATFKDFPLTQKTLDGLAEADFINPTDIQREAIGVVLQGHDILGAAMTGSGKTLSFLIPVIECLCRARWTINDGLGILIISPTRELAYQTFEDLKGEQERISRTNIIVCTPGRLLQHFDETWNFSCENLKMLIIDEADRTLDMGFAETMKSIVSNLPKERQTMLFSATPTKSIRELALVSLEKPVYISVHEKANTSTPINLTQSYIVCEVPQKVGLLWSFIKNHLKSKMIVFIQSCKQFVVFLRNSGMKFLYNVVCKLRPGLPVLALYGTMNQMKRMSVYDEFCRKQYACLFATDIAARGLDFPSINWVIQFDCPADANTCIHRVGRTARFQHGGEALLILTPREEQGMIKQLEDKKAFTSYLRSLILMGNRKVFDVKSIDIEAFASALGLEIAPKVRFIKKGQKQEQSTNENNNNNKNHEEEDKTEDEDDDDNDLFTIKKTSNTLEQTVIDLPESSQKEKKLTKAKLAKQLRKKNLLANKRIDYDEDGNVSIMIIISLEKSNLRLIHAKPVEPTVTATAETTQTSSRSSVVDSSENNSESSDSGEGFDSSESTHREGSKESTEQEEKEETNGSGSAE
ncbi:unnamed protein product [Rotaria socialis]|uniref:ATP-dependent RNA helicase n=1 Tax=Rotaria socialis TaxID=392032 RepID=A0A820H6T2_9BILA|nr:unnamed protein product [Rotaria socialis]